jgi:hypothetical protein
MQRRLRSTRSAYSEPRISYDVSWPQHRLRGIIDNYTGYIERILSGFNMTDSRTVQTPLDVTLRLLKASNDKLARADKLTYQEIVSITL